MIYYSIKIDQREYLCRLTPDKPEIKTEDGWLKQEDFIEYLLRNEKQNALLDLAEVGLDRLLNF
jgi:hypothetical protein